MYSLIIEDDRGRATVVPLSKEEITIGRKDGNTIRLLERNVSRRHAKLVARNGHLVIEDLGSYNGVKINGERIQGARDIRIGDLIQIGDYQMALRSEAPEVLREKLAQTPTGQGGLAAFFADEVTRDISSIPHAPSSPRPGGYVDPYSDTAVDGLPGGDLELDEPSEFIPGEVGTLTAVTGPRREIKLNRTRMTIGRLTGNDIVIEERGVAATHASIHYRNGQYSLKVSPKAGGGVTVNGQSAANWTLQPGDVISIQGASFRFNPAGGVAAAAPAPSSPRTLTGKRPSMEQTAAGGKGGVAIAVIVGGAVIVAAAAFLLLRKPESGPSPGVSVPEKTVEAPNPPALPAAGDDSAALMARAQELENRKEWSQARKAYETIALKYPDNQDAAEKARKMAIEAQAKDTWETVQAAIKQKKWDRAWDELQNVPRESVYAESAGLVETMVKENLVNQLVQGAIAAFSTQEYDRSIELYEKALSVDPDNNDAKAGRDLALQNKQNPQADARPLAAPLRKLPNPGIAKALPPPPPPPPPPGGPRNAAAWIEDGKKAIKAGQIDNAALAFREALKMEPRNAVAMNSLGRILWSRNQRADAVKFFKMYLQVQPQASDRSEIKAYIDQFEEAE
ncbi:MAG: hypothetical protein GMKNLPBB_00507 [Myxococcota bacterium]|nr:hypothetical protein [Myxococcota bacterium]